MNQEDANDQLKPGDDVWLGVDLGRVVSIEGEDVRVIFDRDPDGYPPEEDTYKAAELKRA